ncbi:acetyl-CoA carboxylase family protein [Gandjariella thermophila]|uniref:biotin carboxylase n=1 Tax=Gandjariella thermophila TaxID=1931992 RepID=A0A4D4J500_9PSEU|nr:carboxyl transferase domain-containing protein [Gandjariella thermophila]GDY29689.1 pyruvate carboxylase [Gandjariella thermophila]
MGEQTVLVANRGEIAIRVIRAAAELGWRTCAVYSPDDADARHVRYADEARPLTAAGAAGYLDAERLLAVAAEVGAELVHPGYGFLSESAAFARGCAERGLTFVGPPPEVLELFGDKAAARRFAAAHRVPVPAGTGGPTTVAQAREFLASLGAGAAIVVKAIAGGGGRGMRVVTDPAELDEAFRRCRSEAVAAFGRGELYVEELRARARHVEVQVLGDDTGAVTHLWERDCSIQRRHQKLIEVAPAPGLGEPIRRRLVDAALRLARAAGHRGLGTAEFLVDANGEFVFLEANPRLQVEHTVTEEVTGVDLVTAQLRLATGTTLAELGLGTTDVPPPRGCAIQARVNAETLAPDGSAVPSGGTLTAFEPPTGPGVRVDTAAHTGYRSHPAFDPLLAKVVVRAPDLAAAAAKAVRALGEFRADGVATNLGLLRNVLRHPDFAAHRVHTRFLEEQLAELLGEPGPETALAPAGPDGTVPATAPMPGTVLRVDVAEGDRVRAGGTLAVLEAMKMEHEIRAGTAGVVRGIGVAAGDTVLAGEPLAFLEPSDVDDEGVAGEEVVDPEAIRPDLAELHGRKELTRDAARPDAVARRRRTGQRTARENLADLCDPGSFVEYGGLAIAAQRGRRDVRELIEKTPADGLVSGIGRVNGALFGEDRARCAVLSYDYTVLAGTQGKHNHDKKDRLFEIVERLRLPVVLFAEGGGGRPGDTDAPGVSGLDCMAFALFARLSGLVPTVGIASGRCFAGNAALLGCCDVIIATEGANIGMGGPAMIEGGGLGRYRPEDIGPLPVQAANGVVDLVAANEAEAVRLAKHYLGFFQGDLAGWDCADQRLLRAAVPENRRRAYDVRAVLGILADTGSVLELRARFGAGMVTALARIEGRPVGVVANNPGHLGGAIDRDGADKAARFMQLCDAFDIPILFLCDTPGFMVGPEAEETAQVRHFGRMFVTAASLSVPFCTVVLRKGYGLGAQAMAGGSFRAPVLTVSWPTGEFGPMNLEGAVRLGYRRELEAIADPAERAAEFDRMVAAAYQHGRALNVASYFEIDDVIDPADTREVVAGVLRAAPPPAPRQGRGRPCVDTW